MLSREVGSVAHLSCRIKGNIIFTQEFSAMFSLQTLALTVVGGKYYLFNAGLSKIFCLKTTHSSCSQSVPAQVEAQLLGFPQQCCQQSPALIMHQCSAVLADLEHPGLQRARGSLPSWITSIFSCKLKDLQFVWSVLFCICLGGSSEILTPGKGVRESQRKGSVLLPLYMSWRPGILGGNFICFWGELWVWVFLYFRTSFWTQ